MRYVDINGETFPEDALDIWIEDEDDDYDDESVIDE